MFFIVYKTTNTINGKYYIGFHSTLNMSDGYLGSGTVLMRAIRKYGKEHFHREVLHVFDTELAAKTKEYELTTESVLKDPQCYNLTQGGRGGMWYNHTNRLPYTDAANQKRNASLSATWRHDLKRREARSAYMKASNPSQTEAGRARSRKCIHKMHQAVKASGRHPTDGRVTCRNITTGIVASVPQEVFNNSCILSGLDQKYMISVNNQLASNTYCLIKLLNAHLQCDIVDAKRFYSSNLVGIIQDGKITRRHQFLKHHAGKRWSELGITIEQST